MPLHPQVSAPLESTRGAGGAPLEAMTVAQARVAAAVREALEPR